MIEKISVTNFKSHAHTEIELGKVTALVGPNGCGKTSMLQAAYYLGLLTRQPSKEVFQGEDDPTHFVRRGADDCCLLAQGQENSIAWEWKASFTSIPFPEGTVFHGTVAWRWGNSKRHVHSIVSAESKKTRPLVTQALGQVAYIKAMTDNLSGSSYSEDIPPHIAVNGDNLASAVAYLILSEPEKFQFIEAALRQIVPTIKRVRARPAKVKKSERKVFSVNDAHIPYEEQREVIGYELIFDTVSADTVPAYAMSDGTLHALGLLTIIHSPESPNLILLDDVEQGLHALAQRELIRTILKFAAASNKQILLTTHSAYIIDELEPEDVWVMTTDQTGISHSRRLSEHQDAKRLLEVLTTGELADAVGEDWVLQEPALVGEANA